MLRRPLAPPAPAVPARAPARTLWLLSLLALTAGVLAVLGWTVAHDPGPGLALSPRGLLTVGLAVLLAVLLVTHGLDSPGRLVRAVAEYAAVALLTVLLLTATSHAGAAPHAAARPPRTTARTVDLGQGCPAFKQRPVQWLTCAWDNAKRASSPTTTTRGGHAMASSPTRPLGEKWG
jgi:glucose dehydrogenase